MKWTKRKYKLKDRHKERRTIKRFLFIWKTLEYETRWLEIADIEQSIVRIKDRYKWQSIKFK